MFEIKKYPEFSWSLTRHKTILNCQRKYAYEYYVSHNGWLKYNVDPVSQHTYRLKKLKHLPIFFGEIAHEIIEEAIKEIMFTKKSPSVESLIEKARYKLNEAYIVSKKHVDKWEEKPSKYNMFFDIYYNGYLQQEEVALFQERLPIIFQNFLNSHTIQTLLNEHHKLKINQAEEFRFLMINDTKVFIVMDLLYQDLETNKWVIVDWKTGKSSTTDRQQLALYGYYLQQKLGIPLDSIVIRNEYLLEGKNTTTNLEKRDLESLLMLFKESVQFMKRFQADILTNEPVDLDEFQCTLYAERCEKCNYKEICTKS